LVTKYGGYLAEHFKAASDYKTAERLYMECGMYKEAVQLHLETGARDFCDRTPRARLNLSIWQRLSRGQLVNT